MKTLNLDKPWTYRTPVVTIPYPAGTHQVAKEVHAQAVAEGVTTKEKNDGGSSGNAGAGGGADSAEDESGAADAGPAAEH